MESLIIALFWAVFAVATTMMIYRTVRRGRIPPAWHSLLERHGLHPTEDHVKGELDGFAVKIHPWFDRRACRIRVRLSDNPILEMRKRTLLETLRVVHWQTGDELLDKTTIVRGAPRALLPVLDTWTREALRRLANEGARIEMGNVLIHDLPLDAEPGGTIESRLLMMVQLARKLHCPSDQVPARLGKLVEEDPIESIRAYAAIELAVIHPDATETEKALEQMSRDPSWPDEHIRQLVNLQPSLRNERLKDLRNEGSPGVRRFAARAVDLVLGSGGNLSLSSAEGGELSRPLGEGELSLTDKKLDDPPDSDRKDS